MYPIKLKPIYVSTIWQGNHLKQIRGLEKEAGESCDISAHKNCDCVITNGRYAGLTLGELADKYPRQVLGTKQRHQLLRVKLLDPRQDLSIQVHPDNTYAREHENDEGKSEIWYILSAEPGAALVAGTTEYSSKKMKEAVENDTIENYVRKISVEAGDFFCIETGTLHSLGKGILALEVSQNSDITYRFYDYHRKDANGKERPLHVEKSFSVARFDRTPEKVANPLNSHQSKNLVRKEAFTIDLVEVQGDYTLKPEGDTFYCVSNVGNECVVECAGKQIELPYTESVFVPAGCEELKVIGDTRLLLSYVEDVFPSGKANEKGGVV